MIDCCEAWRDYGNSLRRREPNCAELKFDLPIIKFCPWCGADKTKPHTLEAAAHHVVDCMYGPSRGNFEDLKIAVTLLATALAVPDDDSEMSSLMRVERNGLA